MGCGASAVTRVIEEYPSFYEGYLPGPELGRGSFGTVLSASDKAQTQQFAVKLQRANAVGIKNIKYEAELCTALQNHENIVKLHTVCQEADLYFFIMERCLGTFRDRLMDAPKWTIQELKTDFSQMLHGIHFLHLNRIVHRDIKAENVLYGGPDGKTLKLADFGLARLVSFTPLTSVCGTTSYMAPEMLCNEGYRMPADLWSFGVLCYLTITGECPCGKSGDSKDDIKKAIMDVRGEPEKLTVLAQRVHSELDQYRKRTLVQDGEDGYRGIIPAFFQQATEADAIKLAYMTLRTELVMFVRCLLQRQPAARCTAARALSASFLKNTSADQLDRQLKCKLIVNRPPVPRRTKEDERPQQVVEDDVDSIQEQRVKQHGSVAVKGNHDRRQAVQTQNLPSVLPQKNTFGASSSNRPGTSSRRLGQNSSNLSSYAFGRNNNGGFEGHVRSSGGQRANSSVRSVVSDLPQQQAFAQLRQWHVEMQVADRDRANGSSSDRPPSCPSICNPSSGSLAKGKPQSSREHQDESPNEGSANSLVDGDALPPKANHATPPVELL
jgi:serine/threonine protein kinase